jgi:hypothetical protein
MANQVPSPLWGLLDAMTERKRQREIDEAREEDRRGPSDEDYGD